MLLAAGRLATLANKAKSSSFVRDRIQNIGEKAGDGAKAASKLAQGDGAVNTVAKAASGIAQGEGVGKAVAKMATGLVEGTSPAADALKEAASGLAQGEGVANMAAGLVDGTSPAADALKEAASALAQGEGVGDAAAKVASEVMKGEGVGDAAAKVASQVLQNPKDLQNIATGIPVQQAVQGVPTALKGAGTSTGAIASAGKLNPMTGYYKLMTRNLYLQIFLKTITFIIIASCIGAAYYFMRKYSVGTRWKWFANWFAKYLPTGRRDRSNYKHPDYAVPANDTYNLDDYSLSIDKALKNIETALLDISNQDVSGRFVSLWMADVYDDVYTVMSNVQEKRKLQEKERLIDYFSDEWTELLLKKFVPLHHLLDYSLLRFTHTSEHYNNTKLNTILRALYNDIQNKDINHILTGGKAFPSTHGLERPEKNERDTSRVIDTFILDKAWIDQEGLPKQIQTVNMTPVFDGSCANVVYEMIEELVLKNKTIAVRPDDVDEGEFTSKTALSEYETYLTKKKRGDDESTYVPPGYIDNSRGRFPLNEPWSNVFYHLGEIKFYLSKWDSVVDNMPYIMASAHALQEIIVPVNMNDKVALTKGSIQHIVTDNLIERMLWSLHIKTLYASSKFERDNILRGMLLFLTMPLFRYDKLLQSIQKLEMGIVTVYEYAMLYRANMRDLNKKRKEDPLNLRQVFKNFGLKLWCNIKLNLTLPFIYVWKTRKTELYLLWTYISLMIECPMNYFPPDSKLTRTLCRI